MQKRKLLNSGLEVSAMIPGTTKLHRLDENVGAAAVMLTPADLGEIERAIAAVAVQGARYPEHLQQLVGR